MNKGQLELVSEFQKEYGFKCSTFGAASLSSRDLAVGDFEGNLIIYDLVKGTPSYQIKKAHKKCSCNVRIFGGNVHIE